MVQASITSSPPEASGDSFFEDSVQNLIGFPPHEDRATFALSADLKESFMSFVCFTSESGGGDKKGEILVV